MRLLSREESCDPASMRYLLALICSPLACLMAPRFLAATLNLFLYVGAFVGWLFFGVPGIVLWALGVIHAWIVIAGAKTERRVDRAVRAQRRSF